MEDDVPYYPVSAARLSGINANSIAAGAGGYPMSPGQVPNGGLSTVSVAIPPALGGLGSLDLNAIERQKSIDAQARRAAQQSELGLIDQRASQLGSGGMSDLDRASMLFQVAGALAAPTRTGGLMESLGAAGTAVSGPLAKAAQAQREREDKLMQLQLARAKLVAEMGSGGLSADDMIKLYELKQKSVPQTSEKERLYQKWQAEQDPQRKKALASMLGIDEEEGGGDLKTLQTPEGTSMSVIVKDGRVLDPLTRQPLTPETISGRSTTSLEARQAESAATGVPLPERDIFRNLPPKTRESARAKAIESATRVLDNIEKAAPEASLEKDIFSTRRFLELNSKNESKTGPLVGMLPSISEAGKEMDAIGSEMSRKMRQPSEGATSDYDAKMFQKMTMSTSNQYAVNRNIGLGVIAQRQSEIDRRDFMREYLSQNGTLDGAQKYWKKYLNDNPVFDPRQKDEDVRNIQLNKNRKDWRDYFREGGGQEQPASFIRGPDGKLILERR